METTESITKTPASELWDAMNQCHVTGKHRTAIIVFKQSNWDKPYSELERSYSSYSDQWGWDSNKMGHCRLGNCLDGIDKDVRLDYYNWEVEYWYWKD